MIICQKAKMAIPAARRRKARKMAHSNRKHTKPKYVFQPGTRVVVHILGITLIFEGDRIQLLVDKFNRPKVGYSDDALLPSGKRSLALSISNEDGAQLYFDTPYPSGGDFNQWENRTAAYETWELTPCFYAHFRYKSLELVYKEGRISIWVDNKTDDSYVLPVKVTNNGRTSYQFYVATHNVNATVSDIISARFSFRVRLPGVKHILLDRTGYHKDQSGSIVLEMSVVKEGRLIGNVSVKAKSSKEKVVPELLAQALFDGSLDLSY